ncbi:MAG: iron donor protein CyaY [Rickettsiaceae bacterium]
MINNNIAFEDRAYELLASIANKIEENDPDGEVDVDLNDAILTIATEDGVFVINKNSAAQEIWLSSPISGPYHFAYLDDKWQTTKSIFLFDIITKELKVDFNGV